MSFMTDLNPDDDFLLDDGLPCLRKDGKLYYLGDVQPRVLEACRFFGISFDQLADKLGMMRPALVLILKGYDPVPPNLKAMLDRLVIQAADRAAGEVASVSQSDPAPATTVIVEPVAPPESFPVTEVEVVIPDVVALDQPATALPRPS